MKRATIELEIDLLVDSIPAIADALRRAADELQNYTPIRKGLGVYLLDQQGKDVGCVALFGGARDMRLVDATVNSAYHQEI